MLCRSLEMTWIGVELRRQEECVAVSFYFDEIHMCLCVGLSVCGCDYHPGNNEHWHIVLRDVTTRQPLSIEPLRPL